MARSTTCSQIQGVGGTVLQNRCAQRAEGIAGRDVLGRSKGGREGEAGDSAQRAARNAQGVGWMLWNSDSVQLCWWHHQYILSVKNELPRTRALVGTTSVGRIFTATLGRLRKSSVACWGTTLVTRDRADQHPTEISYIYTFFSHMSSTCTITMLHTRVGFIPTHTNMYDD